MQAERFVPTGILCLILSCGVFLHSAQAGTLPQVHRPGVAAACACKISTQVGVRVLRPDRSPTNADVAAAPDGTGEETLGASSEDVSTDGSPAQIAAAAERVGRRYDRLISAVWREHGDRIRAAAVRNGVPEDLILAVIVVESAGQPTAVSPKGAVGLMQLMPETASRFGVSNPFEPGMNIDGGAALLGKLARMYARDPILMLAAYNAGEHAVERHGGPPPYAETRAYIPRVLGATAAAKRVLAEANL